MTAVLTALGEGWLAEDARVLVERARADEPRWPAGYRPVGTRSYGDTIVAEALWYRRAAHEEATPD